MTGALGSRADQQPVGYVEEQLAQLWCEVLNATDITMGDTFSGRGGDADNALRLLDRVRDVLGVTLGDPAALTGDTLASMANRVRTHPDFLPTGDGPRALLAVLDRSDQAPLSFAQQRLWFVQELDPETAVYHIPTVLHLRGPLDTAALGAALAAMVERHEALRTTFAAEVGQPYQVPGAGVPPPLPVDDLSHRPDPAADADRTANETALAPFDLARGPLLRARLLRLAPEEHRLLLTFHHIVIDGWSLEILYRELGEAYSAITSGRGYRPGPVPLSYTDYARWQRARMRGPLLDELIAQWRSVLGDDPQATALPTDRPRPRGRDFHGAVATRTLGPDLVAELRRFNRSARATMSMTTLAIWAGILGHWAEAGDVTVGMPVSGRTYPELSELVGCLINMVPVRVDVSGVPTPRELVSRARTAVLQATGHQDLPFDKLVEALVSRRRRDLSPVFRVIFSYLTQRQQPGFAGVDRCELEVGAPPGTAKYDLSLYVEERSGGLDLTLEYDTDLYLPETAAAVLAGYERALARAVDDPAGPVPWPTWPGSPTTVPA